MIRWGGHLVEHHGVLPQLCGPLAVGAQVLVSDDDVAHAENRVVQNREELVVGIAQLLAAQTHGVPVHHVCGGEIGHHPTVAQHGFYHEDGVTAQLYGHEAVEIEPAEKVVKGVPEAAPFAGAESTVIGVVEPAQSLAGFGVIRHVISPPFGLREVSSSQYSPQKPALWCEAGRSVPRYRVCRWREPESRNLWA